MKSVPQTPRGFRMLWVMSLTLCLWVIPESGRAGEALWHQQMGHHQTINFLGTSLDKDHRPVGIVAQLNIAFRKRESQEFLNVSFASGPGKFSPMTQVAIQEGIKRAASAAGLDTSTWDIFFTFPLPGVTVYGESISAMVSLAVLAMANDVPLLLNRVATGRITKDGHIGPVGGIPLKIQAAYAQHIQRVIIPDERFQEDPEWETPFLMHVSPVSTVWQAYRMLTGHKLPEKNGHRRSPEIPQK
jgi:predicted S18 family serine protease